MSLKDTGLSVAALTTLHKTIGKMLADAKTETQDGLKAAKKDSGTKQITVELPGTDKAVATITLVSPDPAATITDEEAFLAWAIKNCPSEIERRYVGTVTEVRPAFVKALLKEMSAAGTPRWCNKETGVIHDDVPGVELQGRAQYQRLTFTKTGEADIAEAWRAGRLAATVLPALTAGTPAHDQAEAETDALQRRVAELEQRVAWLDALEAAGVDNWQGMDVARELLRGDAE